MQTFHRLIMADTCSKSLPSLDAAVFHALHTCGVAQEQATAGVQGEACFVQDQLLYFWRPIVQHVQQKDRVARRILPCENVVQFKFDAALIRRCALGHANLVLVIIHPEQCAPIGGMSKPVRC